MPGLCGNWPSLLRIGSVTGIPEFYAGTPRSNGDFSRRMIKARSNANNRDSRAIEETKEPGGDSVLPGQLIADQSHAGEGGHPVEAVVACGTRLVPHGNRDIDLLQTVQRVPY